MLLLLLAGLAMLLFGGNSSRRRYTLFGDDYDYPSRRGQYQHHYHSYEQERYDRQWREEQYRRRKYGEGTSDGGGCLMVLLAIGAMVALWLGSGG